MVYERYVIPSAAMDPGDDFSHKFDNYYNFDQTIMALEAAFP